MRFLRVAVWLPFAAACSDGSPEPEPLAASRSALIDDTWVALPAPEPQANDFFGTAVALHGAQAIVGIPGRDQADDLQDNSGSARLFRHNRDGWQADEELFPAERTPQSELGRSVALSGSSAAVGNGSADMPDGLNPPINSAGLAYAFRKLAMDWQPQRLEDPEVGVDRWFGYALAAVKDEVIVGAPSFGRPGSAYVYEWSENSGWALKQELTRPANPALADDGFGWAIAADDTTLLIGAPGDFSTLSGAVYVFERDESRRWRHADTLRGNPPIPADGFGYSVALQGKKALIGAAGDWFAVAPVAYLFEYGIGDWPEEPTHEFHPAVPVNLGDHFAATVGLGDDWVWISAPQQMMGAVYPFELHDEEWQQRGVLVPPKQVDAQFGMALATAGRNAIIGAPSDQDDSGSAFFTTQSNGSRCANDFDCASQHCVEAICCESVCDAGCYSCRALDKDSGPDGECGAISATVTPPEADCPVEAPVSCGRTGMCDGRGECALYPSKTVCADASCTGPASVKPAQYCDGFGSCTPAREVNCGHLSCKVGKAECEHCTKDADCLDHQFCSTEGCEAKRELASACGDGRECESGLCPAGHCVDGPECSADGTEVIAANGNVTACHPYVCADSACIETCKGSAECQDAFACSAKGSCEPIPKPRGRTASSCGYSPAAISNPLGWMTLVSMATIVFGVRRPKKRARWVALAKDRTHGIQ